MYHSIYKKLQYDAGVPVILSKWHDNTGELQYDVSPLPKLAIPSRSPGCISIYSNMVTLKISGSQPKHLHNIRRGEIIPEFTGKKRKRMIDRVNAWRIPMKGVMWICLTYPDKFPRSWKVWKADLKIYKEHLQRKYPLAQGFWKLELQKRRAPHYHIVVSLGETVDLIEFRNWHDELWANIAHYEDKYCGQYAVKSEYLTTIREVLNYAAKYQTKETYAPVDEDGVIQTASDLGDTLGRLWGYIGRPDCTPSEQILIRRKWALRCKGQFAAILREYGHNDFADYLERQGAHLSFTLYGLGDTPKADLYRYMPLPPPINLRIHKILSRDRAYISYNPPHGYKSTDNKFDDITNGR